MGAVARDAANAEVGESAGEASSGSRPSQDAATPTREKARADLLKVTAPMRRRFLGSLRDMIKGSVLADPDMWPSIRSGANAALDRMLLDIEHEIERSLHFSLLQQQADADALGPSGGVLSGLWWRFRAFVLHHYLPHNRYIFGKLKDPVYLFLYMTTMIPVHGVRVAVFSLILLMILFPGPPDEYQVINYILLFKGMQFLTSGFIAMAMGVMKYFACYSWHKDALLACVDAGGPGADDSLGQLIDYLGSIMLVWIAFSKLPGSKRYAPEAPIAAGKVSASDEEGAGGRLRHLLYYDVKCFVLSFLLLILLTAATCFGRMERLSLGDLLADPQFSANIFWCCNLYSLLSLPFASFSIPGWQTVLTHSDATGFNKHGACVPFGLSAVESKGLTEESEDGFTTMASIATHVLSVMERGREARGSNIQGEYQLGDFGRGLWHSMWGTTPSRTAQSIPEEGPAEAEGVASSLTGLVQSITATGREARVEAEGETDGEHSFSDFSRGLWWKLSSGQAAAAQQDASPEHTPTAEWPLAVASVWLPAEGVEHWDGVTYFCTEVFADGSLDADGGSEPWRVMRRYRDFYDLASRLGPRSTRYAEAPFPPKHVNACSDEMLEERRSRLEAWLRRVLQDPLSQGPWAAELYTFLEVGAEGLREAQGLAPPDALSGTTSLPNLSSLMFGVCSKVPTASIDLPDFVVEPCPQPNADYGSPVDEPAASSPRSSATSEPAASCSRDHAAQDLEAGRAVTDLAARPRRPAEDTLANAVPDVRLGEVLESITAAGRKALVDEPLRKFRSGLWTMLQTGRAAEEGPDLEDPGGSLRQPLLAANAASGPEGSAPEAEHAMSSSAPGLCEADGKAHRAEIASLGAAPGSCEAPPADSPDAAAGTGGLEEAGAEVGWEARLGRFGRGIWSKLAAIQAVDELEEPSDHLKALQGPEPGPDCGGALSSQAPPVRLPMLPFEPLTTKALTGPAWRGEPCSQVLSDSPISPLHLLREDSSTEFPHELTWRGTPCSQAAEEQAPSGEGGGEAAEEEAPSAEGSGEAAEEQAPSAEGRGEATEETPRRDEACGEVPEEAQAREACSKACGEAPSNPTPEGQLEAAAAAASAAEAPCAEEAAAAEAAAEPLQGGEACSQASAAQEPEEEDLPRQGAELLDTSAEEEAAAGEASPEEDGQGAAAAEEPCGEELGSGPGLEAPFAGDQQLLDSGGHPSSEATDDGTDLDLEEGGADLEVPHPTVPRWQSADCPGEHPALGSNGGPCTGTDADT